MLEVAVWYELRHRLGDGEADLGILQLETTGRPDGTRPLGNDTYFDALREQVAQYKGDFLLDEEMCLEADREFVQYYDQHCRAIRRIFDRRILRTEEAAEDVPRTASAAVVAPASPTPAAGWPAAISAQTAAVHPLTRTGASALCNK